LAEFWARASAYLKLGKVGYPERTGYVVDRLDWWFSGLYFLRSFNYVHSGNVNMLYVDGHAAGATLAEVDYRVRIIRYIETND